VREDLTAAETAREDLHRINATVSNELKSKSEALEKVSKDYSGLRDRTSKLHKEVRILRTKTLCAPGQHSRATEAAVAKAVRESEAEFHDLRIKRPDGRIENWVRDLSCRLITVRHLPASQTPGAISDMLRAIRANTGDHDRTDNDNVNTYPDLGDGETFSDRSARRFPLEGHVMGKIQLAQDFKAAPG